jgi:hypothetical protein
MNPTNARRYAKPAGFIAAGLLAGVALAGTVTANAAEDTTGTTGTGTSTGATQNGEKPPCPDKQGSGADASNPSASTVPSSFRTT